MSDSPDQVELGSAEGDADRSDPRHRRVSMLIFGVGVAVPVPLVLAWTLLIFKPRGWFGGYVVEYVAPRGAGQVVYFVGWYVVLGAVCGLVCWIGWSILQRALTGKRSRRRTALLFASAWALAIIVIPGYGGVELS